MESVAALVVPGRVLFLGVRVDQSRVNIDRQTRRRAVQFPEPLTRSGVSSPERFEHARGLSDLLNHPERCRVRRDRPEQRLLLTDAAEVSDALAAVSEHHRQITDHCAGVMTTPALLECCEPDRQRPGQADLVADLGDQRGPGVRHQAGPVRGHFYRYRTSSTHHLQGENLQARESGLRQSQFSLHSRTFPRPRVTPGARCFYSATARSGLVPGNVVWRPDQHEPPRYVVTRITAAVHFFRLTQIDLSVGSSPDTPGATAR